MRRNLNEWLRDGGGTGQSPQVAEGGTWLPPVAKASYGEPDTFFRCAHPETRPEAAFHRLVAKTKRPRL